jgi:PhnB protein
MRIFAKTVNVTYKYFTVMKINPYLMFNGDAEEAAGFYAGVLDGRIGNLYRYSDFPPGSGWEVPAEYAHKVGHCCIAFPGGAMSVADTLPDDPRDFGNGGHILTVSCDSMEQVESVFNKLAAGARKINWPLQEVFYAKRYGEVVDRFGVLWGVMYEG